MRNSLIGWLTGQLPAIVGAYWGVDGVCLVRIGQQPDGRPIISDCAWHVTNEPGFDMQGISLPVAAMTGAVAQLKDAHVRLALAVSSDEIFVKQVRVPTGLSEAQIAQIATVEAVANLPVPPEEICVDYVRRTPLSAQEKEVLHIAFCRRAIADDIQAWADDAGVTLATMDRDLQAIHDLALAVFQRTGFGAEVVYPFGILLPQSGRFLICRDALDLSAYSVTGDRSGGGTDMLLIEQMHACCRRCGLVGDVLGDAIGLLLIFASETGGLLQAVSDSGCRVFQVDALGNLPYPAGKAPQCDDWPLMVATGMALRAMA